MSEGHIAERSHGYSPLHNAAWGGYADLVDLLIERGHPVDHRDPVFQATPLGWAFHCCFHEGRHPEGEYGRVTASLIHSGCSWDATIYPTGDPGVDAALEPLLAGRIDGAAMLGDSQAVEALLDGTPDSDTLDLALLGAAKGGHLDLCKWLLEAGAEIRVIRLEDREHLPDFRSRRMEGCLRRFVGCGGDRFR